MKTRIKDKNSAFVHRKSLICGNNYDKIYYIMSIIFLFAYTIQKRRLAYA